MLSNAGGEGKCLSNCFFMAGLWLKAPWSDFCLNTRVFLQLTVPHGDWRSREKIMRPISGEPLLQCGADVDGKALEGGAAGCDVEGRACGWLHAGEDE